MSMERELYPEGVSEDAIEIEIEDPESVSIATDGIEITLEPERDQPKDHDANLAEFVDDRELASIASDL
ncbi:MAG: hypothetical protein EB120_14465, partial [Proteobacteria bacterium]|nr:hypothetical protein [Pseudomonadota bacterium]